MEREGYNVGVFDYEAAAVGAPHRRERIFFVANTRSWRFGKQDICDNQSWGGETIDAGEVMADTDVKRQLQQERAISEVGGWTCNGSQNVPFANRKMREHPVEHKNATGFAGFTDDSGDVPDTDNRRGIMWRVGELSTAATTCGRECDNGERAPEYVAGERRTTQSGMGGVVDGVPVGLDGVMTWPSEPGMQRVATGVKNRIDRLRCLGNTVVPAHVYPILRAITMIESGAI